MEDLFMLISILSFAAIFIFLISAIIRFIKKENTKGKKQLKFSGISFLILIISFICFGITSDVSDSTSSDSEIVEKSNAPKEETSEEKAAREAKEAAEKALAAQKAKEEAEATAKAEKEAKEKAEIEKLAKLEALKLSGTGDTATKKFQLDDGFVIIDSTYQGSSNFVVKLLDSNANKVKLVANEIGSYSGKKVYSIPAGEYLYEVKASGPWTIQMSQDIPEEVLPEGTVSGKGDSVVFMNVTKGAKTVSFTHDGSSNFVVRANDSTLLVNKIGTYNGSKVQKVEDSSIYFFDITADGNWTMTFE